MDINLNRFLIKTLKQERNIMHRFNATFLFQSIDGIYTEIARNNFDFEEILHLRIFKL